MADTQNYLQGRHLIAHDFSCVCIGNQREVVHFLFASDVCNVTNKVLFSSIGLLFLQ